MTRSLTIPIAILCGGLVVAVAVYFSLRKPPAPKGDLATIVRPVSANDHILGNPVAPVVIVEYSDFDCAYCKDFNNTLQQIVANEGTNGEVAWVFREFPLTEIHPNALAHARAAECAARVGGTSAFWQFADELFSHQPADTTEYGTFASLVGLPGDTFASCYANASSTVDARIMADRQNAFDLGAEGAPFSVILANGHAPVVMDGGYSYSAVKQLVDQALNK